MGWPRGRGTTHSTTHPSRQVGGRAQLLGAPLVALKLGGGGGGGAAGSGAVEDREAAPAACMCRLAFQTSRISLTLNPPPSLSLSRPLCAPLAVQTSRTLPAWTSPSTWASPSSPLTSSWACSQPPRRTRCPRATRCAVWGSGSSGSTLGGFGSFARLGPTPLSARPARRLLLHPSPARAPLPSPSPAAPVHRQGLPHPGLLPPQIQSGHERKAVRLAGAHSFCSGRTWCITWPVCACTGCVVPTSVCLGAEDQAV